MTRSEGSKTRTREDEWSEGSEHSREKKDRDSYRLLEREKSEEKAERGSTPGLPSSAALRRSQGSSKATISGSPSPRTKNEETFIKTSRHKRTQSNDDAQTMKDRGEREDREEDDLTGLFTPSLRRRSKSPHGSQSSPHTPPQGLQSTSSLQRSHSETASSPLSPGSSGASDLSRPSFNSETEGAPSPSPSSSSRKEHRRERKKEGKDEFEATTPRSGSVKLKEKGETPRSARHKKDNGQSEESHSQSQSKSELVRTTNSALTGDKAPTDMERQAKSPGVGRITSKSPQRNSKHIKKKSSSSHRSKERIEKENKELEIQEKIQEPEAEKTDGKEKDKDKDKDKVKDREKEDEGKVGGGSSTEEGAIPRRISRWKPLDSTGIAETDFTTVGSSPPQASTEHYPVISSLAPQYIQTGRRTSSFISFCYQGNQLPTDILPELASELNTLSHSVDSEEEKFSEGSGDSESESSTESAEESRKINLKRLKHPVSVAMGSGLPFLRPGRKTRGSSISSVAPHFLSYPSPTAQRLSPSRNQPRKPQSPTAAPAPSPASASTSATALNSLHTVGTTGTSGTGTGTGTVTGTGTGAQLQKRLAQQGQIQVAGVKKSLSDVQPLDKDFSSLDREKEKEKEKEADIANAENNVSNSTEEKLHLSSYEKIRKERRKSDKLHKLGHHIHLNSTSAASSTSHVSLAPSSTSLSPTPFAAATLAPSSLPVALTGKHKYQGRSASGSAGEGEEAANELSEAGNGTEGTEEGDGSGEGTMSGLVEELQKVHAGVSIVPALLPTRIPKEMFAWMKSQWPEFPLDVSPDTLQLHRSYSFTFIPKGLFSRFIVRALKMFSLVALWGQGILVTTKDHSQTILIEHFLDEYISSQKSMLR
jgi:hypothetical protein